MAYPRRRRVNPETTAAWKARQEALREQLVIAPLDPLPRFVAGVDCAFGGDDGEVACSVAVVWDREAQDLVQVRGASRPTGAPYVPGYLSFREAPAVHAALDALTAPYGLVMFDGQGIAHPRRCGLATHVGVERDVPSVGCAKSRLIGDYDEPGLETGDAADLVHRGELVGRVLRTRAKTRPLFVSIGHRATLDAAVQLVLGCRTRYRLPEPTRLADQLVARFKRGETVDRG